MLSKYKRLHHNSYDIVNKLLVIIHADKMSAQNETSSYHIPLPILISTTQ
jgi:hypothetical protein